MDHNLEQVDEYLDLLLETHGHPAAVRAYCWTKLYGQINPAITPEEQGMLGSVLYRLKTRGNVLDRILESVDETEGKRGDERRGWTR